jgi:predicted DNA-binding transcriptional regulator YafY
MHNGLMNSSVMQVIQEGARKKKKIRFNYIDEKGKSSARTVEPYEIKGDLLYAYCDNRQAIRGFKLTSISSASRTDETFEPQFKIKIAGEVYGAE